MSQVYGIWALRVGASLHLVQLPATLALGVLARRHGLQTRIPVFVQRALGVIGGGIVLAVLWGALWCWLLPDALLGTPFGVMFTSGWLMFWGYRLAAQIFVYGPWVPSNYRWAHYLLIGVFSLKTACFACATQSAWLAFR